MQVETINQISYVSFNLDMQLLIENLQYIGSRSYDYGNDEGQDPTGLLARAEFEFENKSDSQKIKKNCSMKKHSDRQN